MAKKRPPPPTPPPPPPPPPEQCFRGLSQHFDIPPHVAHFTNPPEFPQHPVYVEKRHVKAYELTDIDNQDLYIHKVNKHNNWFHLIILKLLINSFIIVVFDIPLFRHRNTVLRGGCGGVCGPLIIRQIG